MRHRRHRHWAVAAVIVLVAAWSWLHFSNRTASPNADSTPPKTAGATDSVTISDKQATQVHVIRATTQAFDARLDALGYVDFNQDNTAQIYSPYQGRVLAVRARAGDDVKKGQVLFTVESPDLVQAESALISNAAVFDLSSKILERARKMLVVQANAQKDLEQAVSDQQTAHGNYLASRNAVKIFGKSDAEIDHLIATRTIDNTLTISSPIDGHVTARNIAPGTLVQPGASSPAFVVSDLSSVWVVANVPEDEIARVRMDQPVEVSVNGLPQQKLHGTISYIGSAADPGTHRIGVRAQIDDPQHQLHPQTMASFTIQTGAPTPSVAVPPDAVVREGDGSMTVFTTQDGRRFERREVRLGLQQYGMDQILAGLSPGEKLAGNGALFISSALALQSQ
ncbi:cobalt-zinc-cadmium efflux system membrane fusion protein [Rhodanobacter sp. ANJX3]|uniref:efflux RND transporter periplasmic adaptor subunit n=1 Tax=Rhodanobacter sp. ANJX3 TaxID=2723083 RepID=UPI00160CF34E|nr:efflux RND transporter periplasmic adaptor subunit [Rhodanobacter sp. ANJX3]MBB5357940.1 cobalt-zinc-cadmium efflux system membrane fusion protein [Rhodanobacter sp. ANJX3]